MTQPPKPQTGRFAPTPPEGGPGIPPRAPFGPGVGEAVTGDRMDGDDDQDLDVDDPDAGGE